MGKVISFTNQKGGVGKTTTAINLGALIAYSGRRVLIIDIDPQGNAGSGLGLEVMTSKKTIYQVMISEMNPRDVVVSTDYEGLFVIPSNIDLSGIEIDLKDDPQREFCIKNKIGSLKNDYDYIFLDTPPSLGLLTVNALVASNSVLIPLQCEYFALEGLTQLLRIIHLVQEDLNPELMLEGVLLTMYDTRTRLSNQVVQDVKQHFSEQVFEIIIPRNVNLSEAPSFGQPIHIYEPSSTGAMAYRKLAKEILRSKN